MQLLIDGGVEVCHPDGTLNTYPLHRLTRLYDGMEQLEDDMFDGSSHGSQNSEPEWSMAEDGTWQAMPGQEDDWENDNASEDEDARSGSDAMTVDGALSWQDTPVIEADPSPSSSFIPVSAIPSAGDDRLPSPNTSMDDMDMPDASDQSLSWKRFDVISEAPVDHAFYASEPAQPSKSFLGRLTREYRILASSLPGEANPPGYFAPLMLISLYLDSIIVRAFEDRTDLLRCMIIGPGSFVLPVYT